MNVINECEGRDGGDTRSKCLNETKNARVNFWTRRFGVWLLRQRVDVALSKGGGAFSYQNDKEGGESH